MTSNIKSSEKNKLFPCTHPTCFWTFKTLYKLERHMKSHTKDKPYSCNKCLKAFPNKYNLTSHLKSHKEITCSVGGCTENLSSQTELKNHIKDVHKMVQLTCPRKRCLLTFDSHILLEDHLKNHELLYTCLQCGKRFKKSCLLKLHSAIHNKDELMFKCSFENCKKSFVNAQRLKRHQLIHENKKTFTCKSCDKSFNCDEYLKAHLRTHELVKEYQCVYSDCKKYFVTPATLKVHLQTHTKYRPFKCNVDGCDKTYLTASNLKAHQNLHLSGKYVKRISPKRPGFEQINHCIDFINTPIFEVGHQFNDDISSIQDGVVTATFGELAVNQYVNQMNTSNKSMTTHEKDSIDNFHLNSRNKNSSNLSYNALKSSFQDELISTVYSMLDKTVLSGHDYDHPSSTSLQSNESLLQVNTVTTNCISKSNDSENNVDHLLESSMELSTGHLVIDSGELSPFLCMPDHSYSHNQSYNKSTINLDDLR